MTSACGLLGSAPATEPAKPVVVVVTATPGSGSVSTATPTPTEFVINLGPAVATPGASGPANPASVATPQGGWWCTNRWSPSCPTSWDEVKSTWPQIKAAYGLNWELPASAPAMVGVSSIWGVSYRKAGVVYSRGVNIEPAKWAWPLGVHDTPAGPAEFVIFPDCGNLAWRSVIPTPTMTNTPGPTPTNTLTPTPGPTATWTWTPTNTATPTATPTVSLLVELRPVPDNIMVGQTTTLTTQVSGLAQGPITYQFSCDNGISWGSQQTSSTYVCTYSFAGQQRPRVRVWRQNLNIEGVATVNVNAATATATRTATATATNINMALVVSPNPNNGNAPLTSQVGLTLSGSAVGNIDWKVDCNGDGSWESSFTNSSTTTSVSCVYQSAGNYTVRGQAVRNGLTISGSASVIVR